MGCGQTSANREVSRGEGGVRNRQGRPREAEWAWKPRVGPAQVAGLGSL